MSSVEASFGERYECRKAELRARCWNSVNPTCGTRDGCFVCSRRAPLSSVFYPVMLYRLTVLFCVGWLLAGAGCTRTATSPPHAAAERIFVDGQFSDWTKVTPLHTDPANDVAEDAIDLGRN